MKKKLCITSHMRRLFVHSLDFPCPGSTLLVITSDGPQHPPSLTSAARSAQMCYLLWEGKCKTSLVVHPAGWKEHKAENGEPLAFIFQAKSCSRGYGCYCSQLSCPTSLAKMLTALQRWLEGLCVHEGGFIVRGTAETQVHSFFCKLCHGDGSSDRGGDLAAFRSRQGVRALVPAASQAG